MAAAGGKLKSVRLTLPVRPEDLDALELGAVVYLDGVIYTAREGVYQRIIAEGHPPPVDFASVSNVNFHCSPAASRREDGTFKIGAVTGTASFRFTKWLSDWFALSGCKMIIGKGGMSEADYKTYFVPNGAVYLVTVGYGTGALLGRGIKRVRDVYWLDELGIAQAMWVFEVENFGPLLVDCDRAGNSLFEANNRAMKATIDAAYEGLKKPALGRFGETDDRGEELI